jgi:polysaccharide pyruvyl transferase WcaK-like protein
LNIHLYPGDLHNVGDLALLLQAHHGLREIESLRDARFLAVLWNHKVHHKIVLQLDRVGIEIVNGKNILQRLRLLPGSLHVLSGGQLVRDNSSPVALFVFLTLMSLGRLTRANLAVLGCGISQLGNLREKLYRRILSHACFVGARDDVSYKRALQLADPTVCQLVSDLIHLRTPLHHSFSEVSVKDLIIVAPCEDPSEARLINVEQVGLLVAAARRRFPNAAVKIVCHDVRETMDQAVAARLVKSLGDRGIVSQISANVIVDEVVRDYRRGLIVISNRMHAAMFGLLSGSSVIVLDDGNQKTHAIAEEFLLQTTKIGPSNEGACEEIVDTAIAASVDMRIKEKLHAASLGAADNFLTEYRS